MFDFFSLLKSRRSIYNLTNKTDYSEKEIISAIKYCLKHTPSAFNSQSARVIILFNQPYLKLWEVTAQRLKKFTPPQTFEKTLEKISSFSQGVGTILFFEEQHTIHALETKFSTYADRFQSWSEQSNGMLQFACWLMLTNMGLGANLQHYNPVIDEDVQKMFNHPGSWKLIAQMNFGGIKKKPSKKSFLNTNCRLKIFK